MIRCVRIWTGAAGHSIFEEGEIDLSQAGRGDTWSDPMTASTISFRETEEGGALAPHRAPTRQLVITLSGTLEFKTFTGQTFLIRPGDMLLAEDTTGSGHSWRLIDSAPWRRAYVVIGDAAVPFKTRPG